MIDFLLSDNYCPIWKNSEDKVIISHYFHMDICIFLKKISLIQYHVKHTLKYVL